MPLRCPLAHRRGIAISGPFGSANRAASSKPARFFRRWRHFAAFLFPTKPASLGFCGGPYRLRRKEKALFDGVKRKDAGGGIPGFARNARGALYGGFGPMEACGRYPLNHIWSMKKLGAFPDALSFSFCCRTLAVAGDWWKGWFRMPFCFSFAAAHRQLREIG